MMRERIEEKREKKREREIEITKSNERRFIILICYIHNTNIKKKIRRR